MEFGVIAYHSIALQGNEYKKLTLDVKDMNEVWDIALKNRNKFPLGHLVKIELVLKYD